MPFIMRTRNESAVYFQQQIRMEKALAFMEQWNARGGHKITFFHLFLFAAIQVLHTRPRLNRFVAGSRIYQRKGIWLSYSAKKSLSDDAPIVVLKREFTPEHTFGQMLDFLKSDLNRGRSNEKSSVDKELSVILAFPAFMVRWMMKFQQWADGVGLMPALFMRHDPMFASMFIANLGSIKLQSAYHHLYEYGNIPIFAAIGRLERVPLVNEDGTLTTHQICEVKYSFDERIEDGLYCASSLDRLRAVVEDPFTHVGLPE